MLLLINLMLVSMVAGEADGDVVTMRMDGEDSDADVFLIPT